LVEVPKISIFVIVLLFFFGLIFFVGIRAKRKLEELEEEVKNEQALKELSDLSQNDVTENYGDEDDPESPK
jgi:hypothetical protein